VSTTGLQIGAMVDQSLSQAKSTQALNVLKSGSGANNSKKIDKAAHDFESILLGEWLEQAEKSFASVPGSDPDKAADSGHDQMQSLACQFLGSAMSKAGGIGISAMISKHLRAVEATKHEGNQGNQTTTADQAPKSSQVEEKAGHQP